MLLFLHVFKGVKRRWFCYPRSLIYIAHLQSYKVFKKIEGKETLVCKQARPVEAKTIVDEIESSANECFLDLPKNCNLGLYPEHTNKFVQEVLSIVGRYHRHNNHDILGEISHRRLFRILPIVRNALT